MTVSSRLERAGHPIRLTVLSLAAVLSACGGGNGDVASSAAPSGQIRGHLADGYLQGATVYWDCNGDLQRGADEVFAVTGAGGQYTIASAPGANCRLLADVPETAVDEDDGLPVLRRYQMAALAGHPEFISPLTTLSTLGGLSESQIRQQAGGAALLSLHEDYVAAGTAGADTHDVARHAAVALQAASEHIDVNGADDSAAYRATLLAQVSGQSLAAAAQAVSANAPVAQSLAALRRDLLAGSAQDATSTGSSPRARAMAVAKGGIATGYFDAIKAAADYPYVGAWRGHHTDSNRMGVGTAELISPQWVITAGHVASRLASRPDSVKVTISFQTAGGRVSVRADKAFLYSGSDIALAHLAHPVTDVPTVALVDNVPPLRQDVPLTVVGFSSDKEALTGVYARRQADRMVRSEVGNLNRARGGDSGGGWLYKDPTSQQDALLGILHGGGVAPLTGEKAAQAWITKTMAENGGGDVTWRHVSY